MNEQYILLALGGPTGVNQFKLVLVAHVNICCCQVPHRYRVLINRVRKHNVQYNINTM